MNIGYALFKIRKDKKLRQNKVAEAVGLTQSYLSLIETGDKTPSIEVIGKLSAFYGIPFPVTAWLSMTEDDVKPEKLIAYRQFKPSIDALVKEFFF